MILQALTAYYEQLLAQGKVEAPAGTAASKSAMNCASAPTASSSPSTTCGREVPKGKKTVLTPRIMKVPFHKTRTSGVDSRFLCDKSDYILGANKDGASQRVLQCFEACSTLHHKLLDGVDSPAAKAILAFLIAGTPLRHLPTRCWQSSGPT